MPELKVWVWGAAAVFIVGMAGFGGFAIAKPPASSSALVSTGSAAEPTTDTVTIPGPFAIDPMQALEQACAAQRGFLRGELGTIYFCHPQVTFLLSAGALLNIAPYCPGNIRWIIAPDRTATVACFT